MVGKFKDFVQVSRFKIQLASLPHATLGVFMAVSKFEELVTPLTGAYVILTFLLITYSCHINCLYDVDVDLKYKRYLAEAVLRLGRPFMWKLIAADTLLAGLILLYIAFSGRWVTAILGAAGMVLAWIYSSPPLRVKARGAVSFIPVLVGLYSFPILGGWFLFRDDLTVEIVLFTLFYAMMNEGITFVNTAEDYREDLDEGITTLAHVIGIRNLLVLAAFLTVCGSTGATVLLLKHSYHMDRFVFAAVAVLSIFVSIAIGIRMLGGSLAPDPEKEAKLLGPKMGPWFMVVRYPLFLGALLMVV